MLHDPGLFAAKSNRICPAKQKKLAAHTRKGARTTIFVAHAPIINESQFLPEHCHLQRSACSHSRRG